MIRAGMETGTMMITDPDNGRRQHCRPPQPATKRERDDDD